MASNFEDFVSGLVDIEDACAFFFFFSEAVVLFAGDGGVVGVVVLILIQFEFRCGFEVD